MLKKLKKTKKLNSNGEFKRAKLLQDIVDKIK